MDGNLIEIQEPPRMNYGKYLTFKGYNLFGVGQQAVHNAGSSMMTDQMGSFHICVMYKKTREM